MDELSLQSQQLQKEFEIINKRKKIKKSMLHQKQASVDATSLQPEEMTHHHQTFEQNMTNFNGQQQSIVDQADGSVMLGGMAPFSNPQMIDPAIAEGSLPSSSHHHHQYSNSKRKEHDSGVNLSGNLYEVDKKNGSATKSVLVQKKQFKGEHDSDMQHVIKIYDRSNKHFYKHKMAQQENNSIIKSQTTIEEEDEFSGKHMKLDAKQDDDEYSEQPQTSRLRNARSVGVAGVANAANISVPRKKGVRKKPRQKLVKPLQKMKIVVKSTKTISFDENSDEDDSSEHNEESDDQHSHQSNTVNQDATSDIKSMAALTHQSDSNDKETSININKSSADKDRKQASSKGSNQQNQPLLASSGLSRDSNGISNQSGINQQYQQSQNSSYQLPKQTIRLGGLSHHQRKQRQKQKGKAFNVGSTGHHSPLHEARSEDEDEDNATDNDTQIHLGVVKDETLFNAAPSFMYPTNGSNNVLLTTPGANDDLFPMMLESGDHQQYHQQTSVQFVNNTQEYQPSTMAKQEEDINEGSKQLIEDPPHVGVDDPVFHYDAHESLEDEIFELHTHTADKGNESIDQINAESVSNDNEMLQLQEEAEEDDGVLSHLTDTDDHQPKKSSNSQKIVSDDDSTNGITKEDNHGKTKKVSASIDRGLDDVAVEAKCATSNESDSASRDDKDLLGLMNEELEHQTELLFE